MTRLGFASATLAIALGWAGSVQAEEQVLRIAVLNDQNGSFSDTAGTGSVAAAQVALDEVGGHAGPYRVTLLSYDQQNKPDLGVTLAKQAYGTDGVSALFDVPNSAVALAVQAIARQEEKVVMFVGPALPELFERECSPTSAMWLYDIEAQSRAMVNADPAAAREKWFMLGSDYVAGKTNIAVVTRLLREAGGSVVGTVLTPVGEADYSSALLRAQTSGAAVVDLNYAGADVANATKQAHEFGLERGQVLKTPFLYLQSARAIGPEIGHGLQTVVGYYWNRDEASRRFADLYAAKTGGNRPSQIQAGVYSAVRQYLKAVAAVGTDDAPAVMAQLHAMPVDDMFGEGATLRADGRLMKDSFEVEIQQAKDMQDSWNIFKVIRRLPASDTIAPMSGACPWAGSTDQPPAPQR